MAARARLDELGEADLRLLALVARGSSNADMPTYPEWERIVLDHTYETVDHISLHMYFENYEKNPREYLALSETLDRYIGTVAGVIDYVKAKRRSKRPNAPTSER